MGQRCRSFGHCPNDVPKVYVLVSRVTDPRNFLLCGLPPKDLWEDVSLAWARAGLNVADCWKRACSVTNEWVYDDQPTKPLKSRITQRLISERGIPLKNRTLPDVLNPQPDASVVFKRLLDSGRTLIPACSIWEVVCRSCLTHNRTG